VDLADDDGARVHSCRYSNGGLNAHLKWAYVARRAEMNEWCGGPETRLAGLMTNQVDRALGGRGESDSQVEGFDTRWRQLPASAMCRATSMRRASNEGKKARCRAGAGIGSGLRINSLWRSRGYRPLMTSVAGPE